MRLSLAALACATALTPAFAQEHGSDSGLTYGVRPAYLISRMAEGPLKDKLQSCLGQTPARSAFSIAHRGAPLMFPEHTAESNRAAAAMGAGILECDVTFTADKELARHHDLLRQLHGPLSATPCRSPACPFRRAGRQNPCD